jgi:endoglucanase
MARCWRWVLGLGIATVMIGAYLTVAGGPSGAGSSLSIAIIGNHFVNGSGQTIRLLGVDAPSSEYACEEGWGYSGEDRNGTEISTAEAIAGWHADAVRVPLNEDCWLGINGLPAYGTASGYQAAMESWVADLNTQGLYAILDLHWSAPGTVVADGQRSMPDSNSLAFWTSVATAFEGNHAVVFDAFNEPYSPAEVGYSEWTVDWSCWEMGGCSVPDSAAGTTPDPSETYTAVGMQSLVDAIRATGASQPIILGGLDFANDLSEWLAYEPSDPDHQLAASFHNYYGGSCDDVSCWNATVAPVAAEVPVVTGEFDEGYDCEDPPTSPSSLVDFDSDYMNWADTNGVSYLAWGWYSLPEANDVCSSLSMGGSHAYSLVGASNQPVAPDGSNLYAHLYALANPAPSPTTGYDLVGADGGVFVLPTTETSGFYGSLPGLRPPVRVDDIVGLVPSTDDRGYLLVGADGGVFSFGDTTFEGSLPGLNPPVRVDDIVGIVATPDGRGYFLVGADGGVFSFGDAPFYGSLPGLGINARDVVAIAEAAGGDGYWVVEADGTVHGFGSAPDFGNASTSSSPVVAIAGTSDGSGYWVVTSDGGVQSFGDAAFHGSLPGLGVVPVHPVVSIVPTADSGGYWLVASDGGMFSFGDARSFGSLPGIHVAVTDVVGAAPTSH